MFRTNRYKALAIIQIATGFGFLSFWVLFFNGWLVPTNPPPCYFAFEHAFPLPDTILAMALIAGGMDKLRDGSWGQTVSLASSGGLLFVAVIDFSFTAQNGGFTGPIVDALVSALISVWCVALGIWLIHNHRFHNGIKTES
jgi:hypothetical protein